MKYTKTYENFIKDFFKKKNPIEMNNFANNAYHLITYYMNNLNNNSSVSFDKNTEKDLILIRTDIGQNIGDINPIISKIYYKMQNIHQKFTHVKINVPYYG